MPRDPRDVAIDALVDMQEATRFHLRKINACIADLRAGDAAEPRKHPCPHPGCGLRFYRADQVADHLELVHRVGA